MSCTDESHLQCVRPSQEKPVDVRACTAMGTVASTVSTVSLNRQLRLPEYLTSDGCNRDTCAPQNDVFVRTTFDAHLLPRMSTMQGFRTHGERGTVRRIQRARPANRTPASEEVRQASTGRDETYHGVDDAGHATRGRSDRLLVTDAVGNGR